MLYRRAIKSSEGEWKLIEDKVYIHPATGEEYAVYNFGNIDYYNIYAGSELVGKKKINPDGKESSSTIYYYFKDHLGNIRAVIDGTFGTITQAQDYDAWGDICRTYSTTDTTVNKFTGKERDQETGYDYFGARYYDSRIGRWLQTEPLLESYLKLSPYLYGNYNAINIFDIVGDTLELGGNIEKSLNYLKMLIPNIYKDKISISKDENNFVSLNYSSGVYIYDSGLEILGNLINSDKKFLFEVTDNTTGIARVSSNKYLQGEIINFNLNTTSGILNLSITPRNINGGSGHSDFLPKGNYAGQICIGSGN